MHRNELLHHISKLHFKAAHKWFAFISAFLLVVITTAGIFFYKIYEEVQLLKMSVVEQEERLHESTEVINALVSGNQELATTLSAEQQNRLLEAENSAKEKDVFQNRIEELQSNLSKQQLAVEANDVTSVVQTWSSRVAKLTCVFNQNGSSYKTYGSGTLTIINGGKYFLTNKHVLTEENAILQSCQANIAAGETTIALNGATFPSNSDIAYTKLVSDIAISTEIKQCKSKPLIGDRVVILGYPKVGSSQSITATEGIISGFDEGYYVTSAKIEEGNSGGAAILMKDNCFVGIPTLVVKGKLEALARILPI